MPEVKGTIKILENKLIIKSEKGSETWIRKQTISMDCKEWIEFHGSVYEIESFDYDDENI